MSDARDDAAAMSEARRDILSAVVCLGVAVAVIYYGTTLRGDSSMFPMIIGSLMSMGAMGLLLKTCLMHRSALWKGGAERLGREGWTRIRQLFVASLGLLGYASLIRPMGFFSATLLMLLALPVALGYRRPVGIVANAAIVLLMLWLVFVGVFERPLPREFFLR